MKLVPTLITLCVFFINTNSFSQNTKHTASERRKMQKKTELDNKIFGSGDEAFNLLTVPERWANESAVVIAKNYRLTYSLEVFPQEEFLYRNRVKLLDQAAVEFFSEFYFVSTSKLGIKIIKPSGEENLVNVMNAIEVDNKVEIPRFFRTSRSYKYKKLAIPNLEPGDIIDYYYKSTYSSNNGMKQVFSPVIYTLNDDYPVVNQKIEFEVPQKNFYINFNSYNGADKLIEQENPKKKTKSYFLEAKNYDKSLNLRWFYETIQRPTIKFQVTFVKPRYKRETFFFYGEMGIPKSSITKEELTDYLYDKFIAPNSGISYDPIFLKVKARRLDKNFGSEEFIIDTYYYLRHLFLVSKGYESESNYTNNWLFSLYYKQILDYYGIDTELLVTVPRSIGKVEDVLIPRELFFVVKVITDTKEYFVSNPDRHSNISEIYSNVEGADYYSVNNILDAEKSQSNLDSDKNKIPLSLSFQNNTFQNLNIEITNDFDTFYVEKVTHARGHNKYEFYNDVLIFDDYAPQENLEYGTTEFGNVKGKKKKAEIDRKVQDRIKEDNKERIKKLEDKVKSNFELISYDDFELIKSGRTYDEQMLAFKEKFKIKSLITKAGKNYIFNIGGLLTSQIELEDKEMEREYDIYMPYARSFDYVYTLTIPEGYQVIGLEDLNSSVQNSCGGFTSEASKIEGNKIKLRVKKYYNHNYEPNENWPQMVRFLESAYSITQKKLLLKKVM